MLDIKYKELTQEEAKRNLDENMDIDKDSEIYLYCRSGKRSEVATLALADMGFTNAYNIGGVLDWEYGLVK